MNILLATALVLVMVAVISTFLFKQLLSGLGLMMVKLGEGLVEAAKMATDGAVLIIVVLVAIIIGCSGMRRPNYSNRPASLPANPNAKNG